MVMNEKNITTFITTEITKPQEEQGFGQTGNRCQTNVVRMGNNIDCREQNMDSRGALYSHQHEDDMPDVYIFGIMTMSDRLAIQP